MKLLNIGCGATYHPAWVNIDVEPVSKEILRHDATTPLPLEDGCFDVCYCSHVLEHLSRDEARLLVTEIHRVLKPGGIIRLVVPDLEGIVRAYLSTLEQVLSTTEGDELSYDWIMLELLDQMVRGASEGKMGPFLKKCPPEARAFIAARIGTEAERFWGNEQVQHGTLTQLSEMSPVWFIGKIRYFLMSGCAWLLVGRRGMRAVREGWLRTSGEVHRWMYDRFSLGRLLREARFDEIAVSTPDMSRIPGFAAYELDVVAGVVRKPDSLFMEGVRL
ncbi:MAG: hypothetical protein A2076_12770 [Geobacteraceae bacterium GWC2_53_11]|nr:MAG: hypothetical protein A2076_12770 [Geobacteraceae bacterium GWC2_53_11]